MGYTDKNRTQFIERLISEHDRFRAIMHCTYDAIIITDSDFIVQSWSHGAEKLYGWSSEETVGRGLSELIAVQLPDQTNGEGKTIYNAEGVWRGQVVQTRKDGKEVQIQSTVNLVFDEHDRIEAIVSVNRDITEQKWVEWAKAEAEKNRILELSQDLICIAGSDGYFKYVNPAWQETLGWTEEELLSRPFLEFIHPDDHTRTEARITKPNHDDLASDFENRFFHKNGTIRSISWKSTALEGEGTMCCIGRDMTESKRLRAQIAQSDRLASMGMLAAGVAHEINNPLTYVLYNLENLSEEIPELLELLQTFLSQTTECLAPETLDKILDDPLQKKIPDMLGHIQAGFKDALKGTFRIRDVVRGLGTFSRVEKDQLVPINLKNVIDAALGMCSNEVRYRARVVKDFGKVPIIRASEGRLSQVFLNLFINAAHAIEEGDVDNNEIRVRTWTERDTVCIEVRDTGQGIPKEHIDTVFEPFFTTKEVGVGSGLGLHISKEIIESYGGTIGVVSKVGKGTTFFIRIPIRRENRAPFPASGPDEPDELVKGRILIIDDEDPIRIAMVRMLRGHEIVEASTGSAAKQLLEKDQDFDLILCDLLMPEVSGMDVHQWLTSVNPRLAKQVVFISGGAFTPRAQEYLTKVTNLRLEKPFDVANFKKIINEFIRSARAARKCRNES